MKPTIKNKQARRLSATTLGTPIYHRRRRDWRDDQYLIEDILKNIAGNNGAKQNSPQRIKSFRNLVSEFESKGFQANEKAFSLAMWIREELAKLAADKGSYDLRVHSLVIPPGLARIITARCNRSLNHKPQAEKKSLLEELFPDSEIRSHVLERVQLFHKGNLLSYLHSLVRNERNSLTRESATIMDLIHVCEEKLKRRKLKTVSNFNAHEVDLWVPGLSLGIEIRDALSSSDNGELISILKNTNSSKKARFLALVCPDDLSDLLFHKWREIERSMVVPNLCVIRVGDFGSYLDKISDDLQGE
ncbi:MAG: hypothetical protein VW576_03255 [Opitutae bacterium]